MAEELPFVRAVKNLTRPKGIVFAPRPASAASHIGKSRNPIGLREGGYAADVVPLDQPDITSVGNPQTGPTLNAPHSTDFDQMMQDAGPALRSNGNTGAVKPLRWDAKNQSWVSGSTPRTFLGLTGPDWLQVALSAGTGAGAGAAAQGDRRSMPNIAGIRSRIDNNPYQSAGITGSYNPVSIRSTSPLGYADGGPVDDSDHNGPTHIQQAQGGISPEAASMMNPVGSAFAPVVGQIAALSQMFAQGGPIPQQAPQGADDGSKQQVFAAAVAAITGKIQDPQAAQAAIRAFVGLYGPEALQELIQQLGGGHTQPSQAPPQGVGDMASGGGIKGIGDGMSDQIPARHSQTGQPIMLSTDEYVVPADAVAALGNGSSDAGARKLDQGIAKLRTLKYGRAKQPPRLRANANPVLGQ